MRFPPRMDNVTIEEFSNSGVIFINDNNDVTWEAMQLFSTKNGSIILRIGNNTYWFEDGKYDGPEYKLGPQTYTVGNQTMTGEYFSKEVLPNMLLESVERKGEQPEEGYFSQGSSGHSSENR